MVHGAESLLIDLQKPFSELSHDKDGFSPHLTYLLTPWSRALLEKLTGFAANQEILRILWNPKVHYRTHKLPPHLIHTYKPIFTTF